MWLQIKVFWVDITYLNSKNISSTSTLFGFDYISQGKKYFDDEDNFHISFESIRADTFSVKYAVSNIDEDICVIRELTWA